MYILDVAHFVRKGSIKKDKILSFSCKDVACIMKNKVGKPYEFGRAFQVGRIKGNFFWTCPHTYVRIDDKSALDSMLAEHKILFEGTQIESCATDKNYYSSANEKSFLQSLSTEGVLHLGYQCEDIDDNINKALKDHRAGIEAIMGHIKHGGQLGKLHLKLDEKTLVAGFAAMGGFNLRQLMRCFSS